jgi:uncharacterized damage-inducible protein DinB
VADLLECLIQIRALAGSPDRVRELTRQHAVAFWQRAPSHSVWSPLEIVAHLADVELLWGVRLRAMLTLDRPPLSLLDGAALARRAHYQSWPLERALERFTVRRADTLELLASCDAAELNREGVHPRRGTLTIADMVAVMLAHDTDHIGQIRVRLGVAPETGKGER